jgi:membrane fusion protein
LGEIASLEEKRAGAHSQNGFALIARATGTITAMQARLGQPVDTVKPLMTIIPRGTQLQAELYVPSRAIGFVNEGQTVRLLYDAFPYTRFGPGFGTVVQRSSAVLMPEEVSAAVKVTEPVYRVTVELQGNFMSAYSPPVPLQSGMALTADIILEDRSFIALLLDPLLAAQGRVLGVQR